MFIVPLKDITVTEHEEVTMQCSISKPDRELTWFKDGEEIAPIDARIKIMVDGCDHKIVLHDAQLDDDAEYTVKIGDQSTTGRLHVEGRYKTGGQC